MNIEKLPVDFKDDIINEEVNERRKYRMIQNGDETVSFEDVTDYLQRGSLFGSKEVLDTNRTVNNIITKTKFYDIVSLNLLGMRLLKYQVAEENTQAQGWGYAWKEETIKEETIGPSTFIKLRPHTAYRLYIDPANIDKNQYHIFDARLNANHHGAMIKDFFFYLQINPSYDGQGFGVIVYNHGDNEIPYFRINSYVSVWAIKRSDYDTW